MKKTLSTCFLALLIGAVFALYIFKGIDKTFAAKKNIEMVTIFQIGVFSNENNALLLSKKYDASVVKKDKQLYRVYIAISKDQEVTQAYENYLQSANIPYYKKRISIPLECLIMIDKYEKIIKNSFDSDTYANINKLLLNYYLGGCHD